MGQDPGTAGAHVTDTREPEEIRRDIEATRHDLGDTVEALAAKADVKAQAKQKVDDVKASVAGRKDDLMGKAKEASPDGATAAAGQMTQKARENPLPLAIVGGFAAGFLAGRLMSR